MKLIYPAVFKPFTDQSGGYVVEFPDLPGCVTEGKDLEQAIEMGIDAASGWILGELEDGEKIPHASDYSEITAEKGCMINMLLLDIDAYEEKYGEKAVRKNLTIPAWLNTFAEKIISISLNFYKIPYSQWHKQNKYRKLSIRQFLFGYPIVPLPDGKGCMGKRKRR